MAEQFTDALVDHVDDYNPGRTAKEEERRRRERFAEAGEGSPSETAEDSPAEDAEPAAASGGGFGDAFGDFAPEEGMDSPPASGGDAGPPQADATATNGQPDAASANGQAEGDDAETAFAAAMASVDSGGSSSDGGVAADTGGGTRAAPIDPIDDSVPEAVAALAADIADLEGKTRRMLAFYVEQGPGTPLNAHFSAGGSGDRTAAYARNRTLRLRGLVEHVGRGSYDVRLGALIDEETATDLPAAQRDEYADRLEGQIVDNES